ncbi:T9SS type A sorting domain-containing protein [Hymenobacter cavernae]|uniref:Secretion system C-terminal sorting domain-containing protein n=1 Tax=Hymenobacter cavernae TaxID=2044852 RepID=A0ABQ1TNA9_9BACT|nr:T9SS type A sorting domain-containing protein [Hymenobacter cavernae]GGE98035.1 hypothetical protein GCM10011383_06010 [Hymenobacter cavernae]
MTLPSSAAQVSLDNLSSTVDGTVQSYTITAVPASSEGTLYYNASEKNSDRFVVERSLNGQQFTVIGTVAAHGSTSLAHTYSFVDKTAARLSQTIYYRLRQVDTDGTESFSLVRTVQFAATANVKLSLYPNPAVTTTTLDLTQVPAASYSVALLDQTGRTLSTQQLAGGAIHTLDVRNLPAGAYIMTIIGGTVHLNQRLVKE